MKTLLIEILTFFQLFYHLPLFLFSFHLFLFFFNFLCLFRSCIVFRRFSFFSSLPLLSLHRLVFQAQFFSRSHSLLLPSFVHLLFKIFPHFLYYHRRVLFAKQYTHFSIETGIHSIYNNTYMDLYKHNVRYKI